MKSIKLIAETAWHHEGDFSFMKELVEGIIKNTRANIIKLHITLNLEEYMSRDHQLFSTLSKYIFSKNQWRTLIRLIEEANLDKMLLLNDTEAVEFGIESKPKYIEIHSVCLNDVNLLDCIRANISTETRIVLGVGGSSLYEIDAVIERLKNNNIILMHGFQNYPTRYEEINFEKIRKIQSLYPSFQHGYADHSGWDEPDNVLISILGAAQGMSYLEKHVTSHIGERRIDWNSAVSYEMFNEIGEKIELLESCNGNGNIGLNKAEYQYSEIGNMKKALLARKNMDQGTVFDLNMFEFKRTSQYSDISIVDLPFLEGKRLKNNIISGTTLTKDSFE